MRELWPWVEVRDFRGLKKLRIEPLALINLLVGKNGSGKTSVLEAVELLADRREGTAHLQLERRGAGFDDPDDPEPEEVFEALVRRPNGAGFQVSTSSGSFGLIRRKERILWASAQPGKELRPVPFGRRPVPLAPSIAVTTQLPVETELGNMIESHLLGPNEQRLLQITRKIDPSIERLSSTKIRTQDGVVLPISSLGEGTRRMLTLAVSLLDAEGGILVVDEIDTGLHHSILADTWRIVIETARELEVQVFATTHSWDCVRALASALPTGGLAVMHRVEDGNPDSVPYDEEMIEAAVQQGIEVR